MPDPSTTVTRQGAARFPKTGLVKLHLELCAGLDLRSPDCSAANQHGGENTGPWTRRTHYEVMIDSKQLGSSLRNCRYDKHC